MMALVRYVWKNFLWVALGMVVCVADVCVFAILGYPILQALMCVYLVSLFAATPLLSLLGLLILFAIESFVFFSNAWVLLVLAIVLAAPLYALRQWLHVQVLAPFLVLGLALLIHLTMWLLRGMSLPGFWWLLGHVLLNIFVLSILNICFVHEG